MNAEIEAQLRDLCVAVLGCRPSKTVDANSVYADLALALKEQGRFSEARLALEKAIELAPQHLDYYCVLAYILRELHQATEAIETLNLALGVDPRSEHVHQLLAEVYLDLGHYRRVIHEAKHVLEIAPQHAAALGLLAIASQEVGDLNEAVACMEKLTRLSPREPHHHYALGCLFRQQGQIAKALQRFQQVLEMAPDSELAELAWGDIHAMDSQQIQQIMLLASEDGIFRLQIERDALRAIQDRGFCLSDAALHLLADADLSQLPRRPPHWGRSVYH